MAKPIGKKSKAFSKIAIGGIVVLIFTGIILATIYFKLLPEEISQVAAEWSQKISLTSGNDSTISDVSNKKMTQEKTQPQYQENAVAKPAVTQSVTNLNNAAAVLTATASVTSAKLSNNQEQNIKNIVKISQMYSGMRPEEAVAILNNVDIKTVSVILQKMDEDKAAKILAVMDPKRASSISQELLQYKATKP